MKKAAIDDVEPDNLGTNSSCRKLSDVVETSELTLNHYSLAPGEGFPGGLHTHMDQEEVFAILEGEATFETMDGEVTVRKGEVIRFSPGEFQSGKNESDEELVALALGAPRETSDIRIPVNCPECDHDDLRVNTDAAGILFVCPSCEREHVPRDCPHCSHADLSVTRKGGRTVTVCEKCESVFENPPLED
ncbi:cupin domain-containing protein [Natronococcus sp. A-GB7]|uniref:cupin domain-containing protein n=1 Tax=Natronococcus sp. A-GB7 TaxID=3037649 RepID=UPI0024200964|nr:cupin domain-containing protein [Natronococcus sp. A-GB7]MDG5821960.1 cupin domain-containing protein [Natronococcus sp. A-GB7]